MAKNNINIQIINSHGLPEKYKAELYNVHKIIFGNTYGRFSKTLKDFEKKFKDKKICSVLCLSGEKIAGFRVFKIISVEQVQGFSVGVIPEFRGSKLANLINAISCEYLKWNGYKYITSWSHVDNNISALLNKYTPLVSTDETLNEIELKMLNNFELSIGLKKGFYGTKRRFPGFYKMPDNTAGDACFWVYKL